MLDRIDKSIIRILLKYKGTFLTTYQIAKKVGVEPATIKTDLDNLTIDFVYMTQEGKKRTSENLQVSIVEVTGTVKA